VRASVPLERQVKVAQNDLHTSHPRRTPPDWTSPDNAACEGFFGRLKTELFYPRNWRDSTIEQFIEVVDSYIRWYNEKRIKIALGSLSRLEYRESLGLTA
jgi:transposase InsO family protein